MRPVLLEMHGFAAFRESTVVDFVGAEYFALVGPTGAGKSTVIDALTFALYGSVPRWDDRRTVALALSPTANRGTVRLVFDVGSARYVAARELRRAASGGVTVRNARLERLADRSALGGIDDESELLAADGAVSRAVEELLGLPFDQFCTCVVLPQGDFAQFLHARPADRQKTLTRILGIGMYETIAKQAGVEAGAQRQRADLLAEQLAGYADAGEAALTEACEREAALSALVDRVAAALPALAAAEAEVTETGRAAARLREERTLLAKVRAPDGLAALAERAREATGAVAAAAASLVAAEDEDTAARELVAAAPERAPLIQLRGDHAELAALRGSMPGLVGELERARRTAAAAMRAAADAIASLDTARAGLERAAAVAGTARTDVEMLVHELARLAALRTPEGVAELAAHRRVAAEVLAQARRAVAAAEAADADARTARAAASPPGPLEQARRDHTALVTAENDQRVAAEHQQRAAARLTDASEALAAAERSLTAARGRWDKLVRTEHVAALRPGLALDQPCPVCEQHVVALPPPAPASDLALADQALATATHDTERARADERTAADSERQAGAALAAVASRIAALRTALADAPGTLDDVVARLVEVDRLAATARDADETARAARRTRDDADRTDAEVARRVAASEAELRAARDPLVGFGAPALTLDDPATAWTALTSWARREAADRARRLVEARRLAADAEAGHTETERAVRTAVALTEQCRRTENEAARAEHDADGQATRAQRRHDELAEKLTAAPTDSQAAAQLSALDELDARARAADMALRSARSRLSGATTAVDGVSRELDRGWQALRGARDPVVGLGAPALGGQGDARDDLVAAWATLTGWARRAAEDRDDQLPAADQAVAQACRRRDQAHRALADDLHAHEVTPALTPVSTAALASTAAPAAAAALERARGEVARLRERRAAAARLTTDRDAAQAAHQVARMLADLLRSDRFPRWLVASALDTLVADASRSLAELSGGQFELAHEGGELLVVDHADADARRPVKTLSGGETFQASLALALALSAQLSTLAAAGAARLDSIFLDEGFGTLDEANLETVAGTLENLAALGDRMVGVVTHVPALAERVPVRFAVSRDQRTASIVREGP